MVFSIVHLKKLFVVKKTDFCIIKNKNVFVFSIGGLILVCFLGKIWSDLGQHFKKKKGRLDLATLQKGIYKFSLGAEGSCGELGTAVVRFNSHECIYKFS